MLTITPTTRPQSRMGRLNSRANIMALCTILKTSVWLISVPPFLVWWGRPTRGLRGRPLTASVATPRRGGPTPGLPRSRVGLARQDSPGAANKLPVRLAPSDFEDGLPGQPWGSPTNWWRGGAAQRKAPPLSRAQGEDPQRGPRVRATVAT